MAQPPNPTKWFFGCEEDEPAPKGWTTLSNAVRPSILWSISPEGAASLRIFDGARLREESEEKAAEDARRERAFQKAGMASAAAAERASMIKEAEARAAAAAKSQGGAMGPRSARPALRCALGRR
jgi:hypothetical protein